MLQTPRLYRLMFESEKIKIGPALLFNSDRKFSKFSRKPVFTKRLRRNSATNFWGYARFREIIVTKYCVKFHEINFNFVFQKKTDFHIHLYMHIGLFSAWGCPGYCWRPITLMTTLNTVRISGLRMYILVLLCWIII